MLVMAMECDGAFMVTITTLVSCHSLTLTDSEEGDGKRDSGGFTPPHNTIKWWLVGVAGGQAKWMMGAQKGAPHTKHHTAKPVSFLPLTNPMPSYTHPCAISPHTGLIKCHHHSFNHQQQQEGRRTDGGTKEQVDATTKARQHNGHLHGWLGVEPSATTHGHHNQHHHTSTAKACGSPPTPTQPHNSHQPWSPHSTTTMVWSSCLVCVSQMASDWLHGHTLATSNNTPPMPHPQRERGVDGARKTVEG